MKPASLSSLQETINEFVIDNGIRNNEFLPVAEYEGLAYNVLSVNEPSLTPTLFELNSCASEVWVFGSWDNYRGTRLGSHGQHHASWIYLNPGRYLFYYCADSADTYDPYLSWRPMNGRICNVLNVPGSSATKPQCYKKSTVAITLTHKCESLVISGSWDSWKQRLPLFRSFNDHCINLELQPGCYQVKFYADGKEIVNQDVVAREAQNHYLYGCRRAELLDDCIAMSGEMLSVPLKFNVGSRLGSIDQKERGYPCTEFGYMLLGVLAFIKQTYMTGYSWGGCFGPEDFVIVDGQHPQIRAIAIYPCTRSHVILDGFQLKSVLFSRFGRGGKYPPYFNAMFEFLESPPHDLDTNQASMAYFLDMYDKQAAIATPPQRMLVFVSFAQFVKQLPEDSISACALAFLKLVGDFPNWRITSFDDLLLRVLYEYRKKVRYTPKGDRIEPYSNTAPELVNFLRIFFVHGPEHTLEQGLQLLKSFTECLISL